MNYKRFLYAADSHGDLICPTAVKKLLNFQKEWKPHYTIHGGDLWDFAALRNGAGQDEKAHGIGEDFDAGMRFLEELKPNYLTLGNHDDRIWLTTAKMADGILRERCQELATAAERRFKQLKIEAIPYHVSKFLQMPEGGPKLIHGFHSGVNPAKMHYERYGPCIHGHVHAPGEYTARHIDGSQAFSVGCIGDIDKMSYADRFTAKLGWRQGFLYGYINTRTGAWKAWNVTNDNGDWLSPMGIL